MVSLTDSGVTSPVEAGKGNSERILLQPSPHSSTNSNNTLAAAPRLMDVPEGDVVNLAESQRAPFSQSDIGHGEDTTVPVPNELVQIVASPESMRDTFPSPSLAPPYPTASSSTALHQTQSLSLNTSQSASSSVSRPSASRRTSTASSVPPNVYHSPRIAPLSPASCSNSPAPSRAPSLGGQHNLSTTGHGRQRALSKSSASSSAPPSGGDLSRRSSAAGAWRQSFSGGPRMRPPSTLIPAPGHEADTIPPRQLDEENQLSTIRGPLLSSLSLRRKKSDVVVRDFGYTATDERHLGIFPPVPGSHSRPPSESGDKDDIFFTTGISQLGRSGSRGGSGKRRKSSFGGWAGFFGGWGRNRDISGGNGLGLGNVTKVDTDLDLSGDVTPSSSYAEEGKFPLTSVGKGEQERIHHDVWEDDGDASGDVEGDDDFGPEPVGRYKAAYAFESLGGHEMSVEEGEMIEVKGRGGGVGWVIAVRLRTAKQSDEMMEGLVPESYLEPVLDEAGEEED